jgi:hypothetical protein
MFLVLFFSICVLGCKDALSKTSSKGVTLFTVDSSETSPDSYHSACTVSEKYSPAASMACQQKTFVSRETEIDRGQGRTHSPNADGRTSLWSPGPAQQAPLKESGLFNHGELLKC